MLFDFILAFQPWRFVTYNSYVINIFSNQSGQPFPIDKHPSSGVLIVAVSDRKGRASHTVCCLIPWEKIDAPPPLSPQPAYPPPPVSMSSVLTRAAYNLSSTWVVCWSPWCTSFCCVYGPAALTYHCTVMDTLCNLRWPSPPPGTYTRRLN